MSQLTYEKVRSLAGVFGEPTLRKTILLWLFREPATKYDAIKKRMKNIPKDYRVPDTSLYRQVDKLTESYFLDTVKRGSIKLREPRDIKEYELSYPKGIIALAIYAYVLYLAPDTSPDLKKKLEQARLLEVVDSPLWRPYLFFLQWHRDVGIDLSRARIEPLYYNFTYMLALLDHLDELSEKEMSGLSQGMQLLGLAPQQGGPITIQELRNLKTKAWEAHEKMRSYMRSLSTSQAEALLRKLKSTQQSK